MDIISPGPWLCELGSEDPMLFNGFEANCFDSELNAEEMAFMLRVFETNTTNTTNSSSSAHIALAPPLTNTTTLQPQHDCASLNSIMQDMNRPRNDSPCSPAPIVFNFGPSNPQKEDASSSSDVDLGMMRNQEVVATETRKRRAVSRAPAESRDHIMAERKRREKISENFIALSALVPGLKKTDKTSVLGEAIKYMKQMQERLKTLEEDAAKRTVESFVTVKKTRIMDDDDDDDNNNNKDGEFRKQPLLEIEAKFSGKNVLLKICWTNRKGGIVKVLGEIEKLHLSIVDVHATTFGHATLDLTVLAQMEEDFDMIPKHIIRGLRSALEQ